MQEAAARCWIKIVSNMTLAVFSLSVSEATGCEILNKSGPNAAVDDFGYLVRLTSD